MHTTNKQSSRYPCARVTPPSQTPAAHRFLAGADAPSHQKWLSTRPHSLLGSSFDSNVPYGNSSTRAIRPSGCVQGICPVDWKLGISGCALCGLEAPANHSGRTRSGAHHNDSEGGASPHGGSDLCNDRGTAPNRGRIPSSHPPGTPQCRTPPGRSEDAQALTRRATSRLQSPGHSLRR